MLNIIAMRRFAIFVAMVLVVSCMTQGQNPRSQPAENSSNTVRLNTTSTVDSCIHVEAVLLAEKPAAMLFGGFVAQNYAVVKTTVSNRCDDRQFILHDIFFDYRNWALSGVYPEVPSPLCPEDRRSGPTADEKASPAKGKGDSKENASAIASGSDSTMEDHTIKGTCPGQVATVGALDIQDQDTEDAVFSPRNKSVKAITLIGQVASGYAFIWGGDTAKGIGAYNAAFVENVSKLWPDRRIDQEKNILSLGYRTDRSTAIAKDDHGSYYAFFPLKVFLSPTLTSLFLESPAEFLNPAEALLEYSLGDVNMRRSVRKQREHILPLTTLLLQLSEGVDARLQKRTPKLESLTPGHPDYDGKVNQLLIDLASNCPGKECLYEKGSLEFVRIRAHKYLFQRASLNAVQIVVRGVMTVSVDSVPPTIDSVAFDNEKDGTTWTVSAEAASGSDSSTQNSKTTVSTTVQPAGGKDKAATRVTGTTSETTTVQAADNANRKIVKGTITGKFLANGIPSVEALSLPDVSKADVNTYIGQIQSDPLRSSDARIPFSMPLIKSLPNGSKITFMVTRSLPVSGSDAENSSAGSSNKVTSNKYVYTVTADAATVGSTDAPHIDDVALDNENKEAVWQNPGKDPVTRSGKVTGTNLSQGTLSITDFEVNDKTTDYKPYIGSINAKTSSATEIDFSLELLKTVPAGSKLTLTVTTKAGGSNAFKYPVSNPAAKPKAKSSPKAAPKPARQPVPKPAPTKNPATPKG